ncbi:MAG: hypothetical protein NXI30_04040 [bacterium]|nr:hypothetical protein [bacterium]
MTHDPRDEDPHGNDTLDFLHALFDGLPGYLDLRLIEPDGRTDREVFETTEEVWAEASKPRRRELNYCVGVATRQTKSTSQRRGGKEHLQATQALWADIDFSAKLAESTARDLIQAFPLVPSMEIYSGGGLHLYWLLQEPIDLTDPANVRTFEHTLKGIADVLRADRAATDASRTMRLAGTINWPNEKKRAKGRVPYETWMAEFHPERRYALSAFDSLRDRGAELQAGAATQGRPRDHAAGLISFDGECPEAVVDLLEARSPDGTPRYPRLSSRWAGETEDLKDTSDSGIDLAIANLLALEGVAEDDIANALRFRRQEAGLAQKVGDYFERTAAKARNWAVDCDEVWDWLPRANDVEHEQPTASEDAPIPVERLSDDDRARVFERLASLGIEDGTANQLIGTRDSLPEKAAADLAEILLITRLSDYGNVLSQEHRDSLRQILLSFAAMASGRETGRKAHDLDLGGGKTQAILAFITALDALNLPWPLAVAVEKVEANCSNYRQLVRRGVTPEEIGLVHTKEYSEQKAERARQHLERVYASEPSIGIEAAQGRKYMLITQERVRRLKDIGVEQIAYCGNLRPLVIWDEAFLTTEARWVSKVNLEEAYVALKTRIEEMPTPENSHEAEERSRAIAWLEDVRDVITEGTQEEKRLTSDAETGKKKKKDCPPVTREIPCLPLEAPAEFVYVCREVLKIQPSRDGRPLETVKALVEMAGLKVRTGAIGGTSAALSYVVQIPDAIKNVVVLDASFPIRLLENLDKTIRRPAGFQGRIKDYSPVTIHHWYRPSGRSALAKEFAKRSPKHWDVGREVAELMVNQVKPEEAALTFVFRDKNKGDDFQGRLHKLMAENGLDKAAMIEVPNERGEVELKPRWPVLTWGQETGLNDFAYCRHVILCGVLHQDQQRLAAAYFGAVRDPEQPIEDGKINELMTSELAHVIYQAAGRGACRRIVDGKAGQMHLWLPIASRKVTPILEREMPGAYVMRWHPQHTEEVKRARWEQLAEEIEDVLTKLPDDLEKLSVRKLKEANRWSGIDPKTFRRALEEATSNPFWGWEYDPTHKSIVRLRSGERVPGGPEDDF